MLVNLASYGRLGNRLFLGAHLMAFSHRYSVPLLNLGFAEYAPWFPWLQDNAAFAFPWRHTGSLDDANRLRQAYLWKERMPWSRRFRYWGDQDLDFEKTDLPRLLGPLQAGHDVLFRAWLFRGYDTLAQIRPKVLEVFRPPKELVGSAHDFVEGARAGADVLVGVHVRWEDYRGTENFLDQNAFRDRMERYAKAQSSRKVRFVLFSNEPLSSSGWGALDIVLSPGKEPLVDLEAMALCDHLMGPPSTFSGWASFAGEVPLQVLRSSHD